MGDHQPSTTGLRPAQLAVDGALALGLLAMLALVYGQEPKQSAEPPPVPVVETPAAAEGTANPEPEMPPLPEIVPLAESRPQIDPEPRVELRSEPDGRFGLLTSTGNPDIDSDDNKKLTYHNSGRTNNTRIWIDGETPYFGVSPGVSRKVQESWGNHGWEWVWSYRDVEVVQQLELVADDVSHRLDTLRVKYALVNQGSQDHEVGLRVMLDTFIGANDGVPFIVPGQASIITSPQSYRGQEVPAFVRALEFSDLQNPGVIINIGIATGQGERPSEVILTHWPGGAAEWDYNRQASFDRDSAIGMYYEPRALAPRERREISFTYGLGSISSTATRNARLSLTAGGPFRSGGQFWLVALVQGGRAGQHVRLTLPTGITPAEGHALEKPVAIGGDYTQLSWLCRIDPAQVGEAKIVATLEPDAIEESQVLSIEPRDARLSLIAKGPVENRRPFWVVALVQNPHAGQMVELELPAGLKFDARSTAAQTVEPGTAPPQVPRPARTDARSAANLLTLKARLLPENIEESAQVTVAAGNIIK